MKKPDRITAVFGAVVLTGVVLIGAYSALAAGGDQTDPLVTLSYLTQVVTPQLMEKVDEQVAANEQALTDKVNTAIDGYTKEVEQALGQGSTGSAGYVTVSLSAGQTLSPAAGCEVLLCSGAARLSAGTLLDTTAGSSLSVGDSLEENHLYLASQGGTGVAASSASALLVRGGYTVG
jgi:hypothetical protein